MPNQQLITLDEWDQEMFSQRHSQSTLRRWAREGRIQPRPLLVGRQYVVQPDAVYVPKSEQQRALSRLTRLMSETEDTTPAIDDVVMEILNDGSPA